MTQEAQGSTEARTKPAGLYCRALRRELEHRGGRRNTVRIPAGGEVTAGFHGSWSVQLAGRGLVAVRYGVLVA